nr:transposase (putative), gypsy type [Tanacetum cinerariifolium]
MIGTCVQRLGLPTCYKTVRLNKARHKWFWPGFFVARQVCGGTDRISGHGATDDRKDFILTILKKESRYGRGCNHVRMSFPAELVFLAGLVLFAELVLLAEHANRRECSLLSFLAVRWELWTRVSILAFWVSFLGIWLGLILCFRLSRDMVTHTIDTVASVLTQRELDHFCNTYNILADLRPEPPGREDTIRDASAGKIGIYTRFLEFANFHDPLPSDNRVNAELLALLDHHRTVIRRYPETFLCLVGLSRSFDDALVRLTLLKDNECDIGLVETRMGVE